jgi:hypothetical protein
MLKKVLSICAVGVLSCSSSLLMASEIVIDATQKIPEEVKYEAFVRDNAKNVVRDRARGLMWQDDASVKSVHKNWKEANGYCKNLNFAGYKDWHLPSISELETLIDTTKAYPAIVSGFQNTVSDGYWSSTAHVSGSDYAWGVGFYYGNSGSYDKYDNRYVRCVRAGQ